MKSKLSPWLTGQGIRKCQAFCRKYTIWIWRISGRVRRTNAPIDTVLDSMSLFYRTSGSKQIVYLVEHNNCLLQSRKQEIPGFDCIRIQNWNDKKELRILLFLVLLLNASCCCSCNKFSFWLATVTLHMLSWVTSWQFMTRKKRELIPATTQRFHSRCMYLHNPICQPPKMCIISCIYVEMASHIFSIDAFWAFSP